MRFVIISVLPPPLSATVEAWRAPLNALVGGAEALRYPPHVTLRTGLVCPDDLAAEVAHEFLRHASSCPSVPATTRGVFAEATANGRAFVGWTVFLSRELLHLHRELSSYQPWARGPQAPFHPHVTLAFHDVKAESLGRLKGALAERGPVPELCWTIDHVALFHEQASGWVEWGRVSLD